MLRVLVTGGAGVLGSAIVPRLLTAGCTVRIMSRKPAPRTLAANTEWAQADLASGAGLTAAASGSDVIIHAASDPYGKTRLVDVEGTQRLLEAARSANVAHFAYVSIVGVDRIPYTLHRIKVEAEGRVRASALPWSILRATQFFELVDFVIGALARSPLLLVPSGLPLQPIDCGEVAGALCDLIRTGPSGMLPDMGGPQVFQSNELVRQWLTVRGMRRLSIPLRLPGKAAGAIRSGGLVCPANRQGSVTWDAWLRRTYASATAAPIKSPYATRLQT